jgi:hypothetical protein
MFQIKVVQKIKTHFIFSNFKKKKSWKKCRKMWWSQRMQMIMWRMCFACWISKATRPRARARPHTYIHTEICKSYCFSTSNVVSGPRLNVTLHAHCLSCFRLTPALLNWNESVSPHVSVQLILLSYCAGRDASRCVVCENDYIQQLFLLLVTHNVCRRLAPVRVCIREVFPCGHYFPYWSQTFTELNLFLNNNDNNNSTCLLINLMAFQVMSSNLFTAMPTDVPPFGDLVKCSLN